MVPFPGLQASVPTLLGGVARPVTPQANQCRGRRRGRPGTVPLLPRKEVLVKGPYPNRTCGDPCEYVDDSL